MTSPSRISSRAGSAPRRATISGTERGDVVERARENPDVVAGLVHLHARAVELVLERRVAERVQARRRHRRPNRRASAGPAASAATANRVERALRRRSAPRARPWPQIAGDHHRAPQPRRPAVRAPRDGVDQHAFERALTQLAVEEPAREIAAPPPSPAQTRPRAVPALVLSMIPRRSHGRQGSKGCVDVADGER